MNQFYDFAGYVKNTEQEGSNLVTEYQTVYVVTKEYGHGTAVVGEGFKNREDAQKLKSQIDQQKTDILCCHIWEIKVKIK